ncbi:MAG: hypothetical protein H8K04_06255 [Nitrospira sp.]
MTDPWADLPNRCFVSHSYQDLDGVAELAKLAKKAKKHPKLVIFRRVEPDPAHAVSDTIVPRILDCDALIYLRGGASASSFWVSFERDYALRAGRHVYAYDPFTGLLVRDTSSPLELEVRVMFHSEDEKRIATLFDWMKKKRSVNLEEARSHTSTGGVSGDILYQMERLLVEGGPILWLGSKRVAMPMTSFAVQMAPSMSTDFRNDFIECQLKEHIDNDGLQVQEFIAEANEDFYEEMDPYIFTPEIMVRIDPSLPSSWQLPGSSLLDLLKGKTKSFDWNRIDDLIIRLYAVLLQQRRRRTASPPESNAVSVEDLGLLVLYWDESPEWMGRIRIGGPRNPQGARIAINERWWLGRWDGQKLFHECVLLLSKIFAKSPSRVSRQTHPHLLFDEDLAPASALAWLVEPAVVELSLVFEGPYSMVCVRRYPIAGTKDGLLDLTDQGIT